jgi:GT2 family glycosyltransferase
MTTSSTPFFTVVILSHNYGRYIRQAIESVLQQTCASWELFIRDDASTDDTAKIVEPFLTHPRIHFIRHNKNLGQSANWSGALDLGTAPVFALLHADDYWLPEALQTARDQFASDAKIDLVYSNWLVARENLEQLNPAGQSFDQVLTGPQTFAHQITRNLWLPSAMFIRRALIQSAGKPNPNLRVHVDLEYHLRLAANARRVSAISKALTVYRVHEQSVTTRSSRDGELLREMQEFPNVISRWASGRPELANCMPTLWRIAAEGLLSAGITASVKGDRAGGIQLMRRAAKISRGVRLKPKALVDRLLLSTGSPGYRTFCYLHRSRMNA